MRGSRILSVLVVSGCLAASVAAGADKKAEPKKAGDPKAAPPMSPEQAKMMEIWQAYMTPSEGHKKMEPWVGSWSAKVKSWMSADAPPEESTAESTIKWILGGRYLEQRHKGSMMGQAFEGIGYTAFDNSTKKYVSTWFDNMGTGVMVTKGEMDASGKVLTETGTFDDPMTGKPNEVKTVATFKDANTMTFEMWAQGHDGKTYKNLEITYTRKAKAAAKK